MQAKRHLTRSPLLTPFSPPPPSFPSVPPLVPRPSPRPSPRKDMRFALALGDAAAQPLPLACAANNAMIAARAMGHGDDDFSATYEGVRPKRAKPSAL